MCKQVEELEFIKFCCNIYGVFLKAK